MGKLHDVCCLDIPECLDGGVPGGPAPDHEESGGPLPAPGQPPLPLAQGQLRPLGPHHDAPLLLLGSVAEQAVKAGMILDVACKLLS